jgi:hypothetical protein
LKRIKDHNLTGRSTERHLRGIRWFANELQNVCHVSSLFKPIFDGCAEQYDWGKTIDRILRDSKPNSLLDDNEPANAQKIALLKRLDKCKKNKDVVAEVKVWLEEQTHGTVRSNMVPDNGVT